MGFKLLAVVVLINVIFFSSVSSQKVICPPKTLPLPSPAPKKLPKCPKDTLKFGVCGSWLDLIYEEIGDKPSQECCTLIQGLADVEAALCLCTALKANVMGVVKVEIPIALSLLVNGCGKEIPSGFTCA